MDGSWSRGTHNFLKFYNLNCPNLIQTSHISPHFMWYPKYTKNQLGINLLSHATQLYSTWHQKLCKMLKPLYANCPFVIHGSKDSAIKLSKLKLPQHHRVFIISGDITAYYLNIPTKVAIPSWACSNIMMLPRSFHPGHCNFSRSSWA